MQKKVMAIHDISCIGRCSLTVALPILSCAGIETSVLPTAILSTHTGEFTGYTYRDLSCDIPGELAHFATLGLAFDGLYSGFLGSNEQIALIKGLFSHYKSQNNLIMVDPAMADNGRLYATYTKEMAQGAKQLCAMADIIVPNLTEAAILLDIPYQESLARNEIEALVKKLSLLGPKQVVLTGITNETAQLGCAAYDRQTNSISYAFAPRYKGAFHGTGDVFASALLSGLILGYPLAKSAKIANDFVHLAIRFTLEAGTPLRYGVHFEKALPFLMDALGLWPTPAPAFE